MICFICLDVDGLLLVRSVRLAVFVGEALGAIGDSAVLDLLKEYSQDPFIEVGAPETSYLSPCSRPDQLLSVIIRMLCMFLICGIN